MWGGGRWGWRPFQNNWMNFKHFFTTARKELENSLVWLYGRYYEGQCVCFRDSMELKLET